MRVLSAEQINELLERPTDDPLKKWNAIQRRLSGDAPVREMIIALQQARSQFAMNTLMYTLGTRGAMSAIPVLASYLDDANPSVRGLAVDSIERIAVINNRRRRKRRVTPASSTIGQRIMERFEKTEPVEKLRPGLALALGALHYEPAIPALIEALGGTDRGLRVCAAIALGELQASEAIPELSDALSIETDEFARTRINYVIEELLKSPGNIETEVDDGRTIR